MPSYIIERASAYAWERLHLPDPDYAYVHSVYRKTINISLGGQLLALQAKDSPLSPISLITNLTQEEMAQLPIAPRDRVVIRKDGILLANTPFFYLPSDLSPEDSDSIRDRKDIAILSTRISPSHNLQKLKIHILSALQGQDFGGFDRILREETCSDPFSFLPLSRKRLSTAKVLLEEERWEEAARELSRLMGLGIGLTPSGDDFLCGLLAGLHLMKLQTHPLTQALKEEIQENLRNTNDISGAFLQCACMDHFSQALCQLDSMSDVDVIFRAFARIGHSSGMDTLSGVYYILTCFQP